jgi:hypothetical protein
MKVESINSKYSKILKKQFFLVILMLQLFSIVAFPDNVSLQEVLDAGLPVLTVTTVNGEEPTYERVDHPNGCNGYSITNATKVPARLTISRNGTLLYDSGEYVEDKGGITVKVRGNTSALVSAKKPYKLKLQKKADLLCRGDDKFKDKNWALIRDEHMLTKVGLKINELGGLQWTPVYEYVNVVFNGDYRGVYMLVETVERNTKCRLNVADNGYVIEYDAYWWNEDKYIFSKLYYAMNYTYKYPDSEKVTEEQHTYIKDFVAKFDDSLQLGTYQNYIDVKSYAAWMFCREIYGLRDGTGSNMFLTKYDNKDETKLQMANMWDFDSAMQMNNEWDGVHNVWFFGKLFQSANRLFVREFIKRWYKLRPTIFDQIDTYMADYANSEEFIALEKSLELDYKRWGENQVYPRQEIDNIRQWFVTRKVWLDENISKLNIQETKPVRLGDVNDDGIIDDKDVKALASHIMGNTPTDFEEELADVNEDTKVDVADVVMLINK